MRPIHAWLLFFLLIVYPSLADDFDLGDDLELSSFSALTGKERQKELKRLLDRARKNQADESEIDDLVSVVQQNKDPFKTRLEVASCVAPNAGAKLVEIAREMLATPSEGDKQALLAVHLLSHMKKDSDQALNLLLEEYDKSENEIVVREFLKGFLMLGQKKAAKHIVKKIAAYRRGRIKRAIHIGFAYPIAASHLVLASLGQDKYLNAMLDDYQSVVSGYRQVTSTWGYTMRAGSTFQKAMSVRTKKFGIYYLDLFDTYMRRISDKQLEGVSKYLADKPNHFVSGELFRNLKTLLASKRQTRLPILMNMNVFELQDWVAREVHLNGSGQDKAIVIRELEKLLAQDAYLKKAVALKNLDLFPENRRVQIITDSLKSHDYYTLSACLDYVYAWRNPKLNPNLKAILSGESLWSQDNRVRSGIIRHLSRY